MNDGLVRLTLRSGDRVQLVAADVTEIESVPGGSVIHQAAGEPLTVAQDARTVALRVKKALADGPKVSEPPLPEPPDLPAEPPGVPIDTPVRRPSLGERAKRALRGRSSLSALAFTRRR